MIELRIFQFAALSLLLSHNVLFADAPTLVDYCQRLQQEVQGRKHGFLAGNVTYYVGGFHASWDVKENETLGLTHPFFHDLRSRGVGLAESSGNDHDNTGLGNDFSGWEFYKDTRVLYGSVIVDGRNSSSSDPPQNVLAAGSNDLRIRSCWCQAA